MRLILAGTPSFAVPTLQALSREHTLVLVVTQPDRPAGRGLEKQPSAVKQAAEALGLAIYQPASLKAPEAIQRLRSALPDAMVVVAYGLLLPAAVLELAPHGALNIHASLLPRWRGAAPIQRAILAGDAQTGISIMRMDVGLDTGPVLLQDSLTITDQDTAGTLHDKLAHLGATLITRVLAPGGFEQLTAQPQGTSGVTYAQKIDRGETVVKWDLASEAISRTVRAFDPSPGAVTSLGNQAVKLWRARASPGSAQAAPGTVISVGDELAVACGSGILHVSELQRAGGRRMAVREFLRGCHVQAGDRFGAGPADNSGGERSQSHELN